MLILLAFVHVTEDGVEKFAAASTANAIESLKEPGCKAFNVIQQNDDPRKFVLHEIYDDQAALDVHKLTPHYEAWRVAVEDLMAEPRYGVKYHEIHHAEL
jgi:quinol monooxygenase YgiN